jgi:hypothetical protein
MSLTATSETLVQAKALKMALASTIFGAAASAALDENRSYLASIPPGSNIRGFGFGAKSTGTSITADDAVRVYVRTKLPKRRIPANEIIPETIEGYPTDVIAVGDIRPFFPRPAQCGVSIGHVNVTAGTLGCLVENAGGVRFILSNNHVLADSNAGAPGDDILEPGRADGGAANPPIAHLTDFEPLDFSGAINHIDCAIAEPIVPGSVLPEIVSIGRVTPASIAASKHLSVVNQGRTTGHTLGTIDDIAADVTVTYGMNTAAFEGQITVSGTGGLFSQGGDSGSLVLDALGLRPVGLLFAGGGTSTFCNPIDLVMARFSVTIV